MAKNGNLQDRIRLYGFDKKPELKKITGYIERTKGGFNVLDLYSDELRALYLAAKTDMVGALVLAFIFGQAKGVRTARREDVFCCAK